MITEAQNQIIKQIDTTGVTAAIGRMGYWFAAEWEEIDSGDKVFEFISTDKPKILLVIKGEQDNGK